MNDTHVHMVGIGGIGMSALAQLYRARGAHVRGSDRSESPVTELLERKEIEVVMGHHQEHVGAETTLLVYSDAVPADNPERIAARERNIRELSYFEALGEATRTGTSIIVSGTHGKTTTTAMLAKILIDTGRNPTVIAGSILSEQGSNFIDGRPDLFVIEGCEYRRHFLNLHPTILVITNIELDHTDYYKDLPDMQDAFVTVATRVPPEGSVITNTDAPSIKPILADVVARKIPYQDIVVPTLKVPGTFNEENARAAKAAAYAYDPELHEADIDCALASFAGTWRRFEYKGVTNRGAVVYDDYAHHPTAVQGTIRAARILFPDKRIVVAFHPHLYSRTRDFLDAFATALAQADEVLLAPIYPAREEPIPGISSAVLAEKVTTIGTPAKAFTSLDALYAALASDTHLVTSDTCIITMGAGDIYRVADMLTTHG